MSASATPEEVAMLLTAANKYMTFWSLIGIPLGIAAVLLVIFWEATSGRAKPFYANHFALIFFLFAIGSHLFALITVYYGVPKLLTFGVQVGKILPPTCEASMPFEGRQGTPCTLKRFMAWVEHLAEFDGSLHLEEVERTWVRVGVCVIMSIAGLLFAWLVVPHIMEQEYQAAQAAAEAKQLKAEKESYSGLLEDA